jgi:hypothetical protein
MATNKTRKTTKKVAKPIEDFVIEEVIETQTLSDEELFFGVEPTKTKVTKTDYRNPKRFYNVFVQANGRTIKVNGMEVGAFLGLQSEAKRKLENGAKKVDLFDRDGKLEYKIEVI